MNRGRGTLLFILAFSALICIWDIYVAVRGQGHNSIAWFLAGLMALIALGSLRKLIRGDYSNSLW